MQKIIYVYVLDTMADWELSHVVGELHSGRYFKKGAEKFVIKTVAANKQPIVTMGGFKVLPDVTVEQIQDEQVAGLLLPGADTWGNAIHTPIVKKAKLLLDRGVLVGAMCGATSALAQAGIFDSRAHTSNDLGFLRMTAPNYKAGALYKKQPAVSDNNLITASAAGNLEFARLVLKHFDALGSKNLESWYDYFKTSDARHFFALLKNLPKA